VVCDHITRAKVASAPKDRIEHIHFSGGDSEVDFFGVCKGVSWSGERKYGSVDEGVRRLVF
jgi:hypothetical protein